MNGDADDRENGGQQSEHRPRLEPQLHHRAKHERDVHRRQHEDEVRGPHQDLVQRAADVAGDAARRTRR